MTNAILIAYLFGLLLLLGVAHVFGADSRPLTETAQLRILNSYRRAFMKQEALDRARADFAAAASDYEKVCAAEAGSAGYPAGSTCNVDLDHDTVRIEPKKEAEKK